MAAEVHTTTEIEKPLTKNREVKKVIAENVKGHVKWYDATKNYGFISRDDDGGDVFVHRSVISQCARRHPSLRAGEEVQFSVVETSQGIEAYLVTGPEGKPVKGQISRYPRRSGGRIREDHHYDDYAHTDNPSGGENSEAGQQQQPGSHSRGSQRRGGYRAARQSKDTHSSGDVAPAAGNAHDPSEGDSPNQLDLRQRRPRRRPPTNRNQNPQPSGNGLASGSTGNVVHHQSDGGDEQQQPSRMRRRPRRRRPANGQPLPKEAGENGQDVQHGEGGEQINGYHGPRRRGGPYRGQRRHNSNSKQTNSPIEVVHSTVTDLAVEEIVAATEQCNLDASGGVVVQTIEELAAK